MTSIITYRNPLEQWFWEGGAIYVLAAIVVTFCLYAGYYFLKQLLCKHKVTYRRINGTYKCRNCEKILREKS